jgi:hypothetical protein
VKDPKIEAPQCRLGRSRRDGSRVFRRLNLSERSILHYDPEWQYIDKNYRLAKIVEGSFKKRVLRRRPTGSFRHHGHHLHVLDRERLEGDCISWNEQASFSIHTGDILT